MITLTRAREEPVKGEGESETERERERRSRVKGGKQRRLREVTERGKKHQREVETDSFCECVLRIFVKTDGGVRERVREREERDGGRERGGRGREGVREEATGRRG